LAGNAQKLLPAFDFGIFSLPKKLL